MAGAISQRAGSKKETGEHQSIGINDPQLLGIGGVQLLRKLWQCGVEDGVIQSNHE